MSALRKVEASEDQSSLNSMEIAKEVSLLVNQVHELFNHGEFIQARKLLFKQYLELREIFFKEMIEAEVRLFIRDCMREVMCVYCDERNFPRNKNLISDFVRIYQIQF